MQTVITVDLGGTKLNAAVLDEAGQVLTLLTQPTDNNGREAILNQLRAVIEELRVNQDVVAVGLGTPGFIDSAEGKVLLATNLPGWSGTAVGAILQQATSFPVAVENDANAAAIGEAWLGSGRNRRSFVMLTLGTGVGGAIFSQEHGIWQGSSFRSGEFGHSVLYPGGRPCACGQRGCVDQYLSGRAIQLVYREQTGKDFSGKQVLDLARAGELTALQVVRQFSRDLSVLLTSLQNILDPEVFILGGGLLAAKDVWGEPLISNLACLAVHGCEIKWIPAQTGSLAGLFGAGKLAWDYWRRQHA